MLCISESTTWLFCQVTVQQESEKWMLGFSSTFLFTPSIVSLPLTFGLSRPCSRLLQQVGCAACGEMSASAGPGEADEWTILLP